MTKEDREWSEWGRMEVEDENAMKNRENPFDLNGLVKEITGKRFIEIFRQENRKKK